MICFDRMSEHELVRLTSTSVNSRFRSSVVDSKLPTGQASRLHVCVHNQDDCEVLDSALILF